MWSAVGTIAATPHGKIYGATSLGGTASLLLDISPDQAIHFMLHYDIDEDIFIAVPDRRGYPIYTSSDDGTTWLKGDILPLAASHKPVKYDTTENIYIMPLVTNGSDDQLFTAMKRDSDGFMRIITMQERAGAPFEHFSALANNITYMITSNPDTSLAIGARNTTNGYQMDISQNLTTEFATMNVHNTRGGGSSNGGINVPIGNYLGMRVKL